MDGNGNGKSLNDRSEMVLVSLDSNVKGNCRCHRFCTASHLFQAFSKERTAFGKVLGIQGRGLMHILLFGRIWCTDDIKSFVQWKLCSKDRFR